MSLGVPTEKIYCDFASFRTLDSIIRAKEVFGQAQLTIISQKFHNERAIFIAQHKGLNAIGFNAEEIDAYNGFRTKCREQLARVKAVLDIYVLHTKPKFLGDQIGIGFLAQ